MRELDKIKDNYAVSVEQEGLDGFMAYWEFNSRKYLIIVSNGGGWEHISISSVSGNHLPSWNTMCALKNLCFLPGETVVQYHPAESNYVNIVNDCLHLWQPQVDSLPLPPVEYV